MEALCVAAQERPRLDRAGIVSAALNALGADESLLKTALADKTLP